MNTQTFNIMYLISILCPYLLTFPTTQVKACPECHQEFPWSRSGYKFSNREFFDHIAVCGLGTNSKSNPFDRLKFLGSYFPATKVEMSNSSQTPVSFHLKLLEDNVKDESILIEDDPEESIVIEEDKEDVKKNIEDDSIVIDDDADDEGEEGSDLIIDLEESSDGSKSSKTVIDSTDSGSRNKPEGNTKDKKQVGITTRHINR